jgi:hypothetical protein
MLESARCAGRAQGTNLAYARHAERRAAHDARLARHVGGAALHALLRVRQVGEAVGGGRRAEGVEGYKLRVAGCIPAAVEGISGMFRFCSLEIRIQKSRGRPLRIAAVVAGGDNGAVHHKDAADRHFSLR